MISLELTDLQLFLFVSGFIYLVIVSIFGNRFHTGLDRIKKLNALIINKRIEKEQAQKEFETIQIDMQRSKRHSYMILAILYLLQLIVLYILIDLNVESVLLTSGLVVFFVFILFGVYWLKGASTLNKNMRFGSEYFHW